jgi:exonuclease VII small subunit
MSDYIPDNLGLWQEHDRLNSEFEEKLEALNGIVKNLEKASRELSKLGYEEYSDQVDNVISRLEDER